MNRYATLLAVASAAALLTTLHAADAQPRLTIDQAAVMAGNVTPGDAPGFPLTLSRPGHYRLTSDLAVPADTAGIVISGPGVTLDLGGHRVGGTVRCGIPAGSATLRCDEPSQFSAKVGISTVAATGAVIRNGSVAGFPGLGIHYGEATVLSNLRVVSNSGVGIGGGWYAAGGRLSNVRVERNGGPGIVCEAMTIEHSMFVGNAGDGIDCLRSRFSDSIAEGNGGYGVAQGPVAGVRSIDNAQGEPASMASAGVRHNTLD